MYMVRSLNIVMMSVFPKLIYRFNATTIKMLAVFEIAMVNLRSHIDAQRS